MASKCVVVHSLGFIAVDDPVVVAYFTEESLDYLQTIDELPHLASLPVPHGEYKSARSTKGRPESIFNPEQEGQEFPRIEYIPWRPKSPSVSDRSSHSPPERATESILRKWIVHDKSGRVIPTNSNPSQNAAMASAAIQPIEESLAPLVYLQTISPPRRHPEDEKTLKLLATKPM
jgi:Gti1/Pac2 family transcription factor